VAGSFAAPAAFAATANVDIYGRVNIAIQDTNASGNAGDLDVVTNPSRIGFKGSEDLGGGLKALWQIEQQFNATGDSNAAFGNAGLRNTFIGVAGGFGTALIGRHDTPYKIATGKYNIFVDTIGEYNGRAMNGHTVELVDATHNSRATNAIAYISPNFSGLTVAAAVVASNDAATTTAAGATLNSNEDNFDAYSVALMYANGPLTVDFGWQDVKEFSDAWKLGVGYTFGDAKVGFVYEDMDRDGIGDLRKSWLLNGAYNLGAITLKAQYGRVKWDAGGRDKAMMLGADYSMSKRTTAYVVYAHADEDGESGKGKGWNIGLAHNF